MRARLRHDNNSFRGKWGGILNYPKILIAQAHGYLLGQALDTFLHCDFIIGSEDCKFGEVEDRLGLAGYPFTDLGVTLRINPCIGYVYYRENDRRKRSCRISLINWAVPADKLEENVNNLAEGLSKYPRDGIALGKSSRQLLYDILGVTNGISHAAVMHSLQTNIHFEEGEFGFFKARRDLGVKDAIAERNRYYELLNNPDKY